MTTIIKFPDQKVTPALRKAHIDKIELEGEEYKRVIESILALLRQARRTYIAILIHNAEIESNESRMPEIDRDMIPDFK
jgi:hypothetical protein